MKPQIYYDARQIELPIVPKVMWLASWYPSRTSPYNGDFIQRHAIATSQHTPILLIHTIHDVALKHKVQYEVVSRGGLTEIIVYFHHDGITSTVIEKISYNALFNKYIKQLIVTLVAGYGQPSLLHVHVPVKMGRIALWAKKKWGLPYIVSEQSSAYLPSAQDAYQKRNWIYRTSVKKIFRDALAITNVSVAVGRIISQLFDRPEIRVIRNLADPSIFFPVPKPKEKICRFIHVSTLKYQKNVRGILEAMQMLWARRNDFELTLIGGEQGIGEEWPPGIENAPWLRIKGMVEHDQVAVQMQRADCLVMFSRDENFPCVIVEALCCGLPVITSDAGGCSEAIDPTNGLVVKSEHLAGLVNALEQMIDDRGRYDQQVIANAAIKQYGSDSVGKDFVDLYQELGIL